MHPYLLVAKLLSRSFSLVKTRYFRSIASVHRTVSFLPGARIYNIRKELNSIEIGPNSVVGGDLLTFAHGGSIRIGEWCYVGEHSRIWSASQVSIGNRVLISHGVDIHDTDSHSLCSELRHKHFVCIATTGHPLVTEDIDTVPVIIEDDVWVGCKSIILKGVTIGRASIVAAGSVVTKSVPNSVLVAGNPARIIREIN
jgi:acetyltransferase-like isoleucine patch superfamily enzyme